jgi:hypothetical protein
MPPIEPMENPDKNNVHLNKRSPKRAKHKLKIPKIGANIYLLFKMKLYIFPNSTIGQAINKTFTKL